MCASMCDDEAFLKKRKSESVLYFTLDAMYVDIAGSVLFVSTLSCSASSYPSVDGDIGCVK